MVWYVFDSLLNKKLQLKKKSIVNSRSWWNFIPFPDISYLSSILYNIHQEKKNHMQTYSRLEKRFRSLAKENINAWGKENFIILSCFFHCLLQQALETSSGCAMGVSYCKKRKASRERSITGGVLSRLDTKRQRLTYWPSAYTESCFLRRGGWRNFPHPLVTTDTAL